MPVQGEVPLDETNTRLHDVVQEKFIIESWREGAFPYFLVGLFYSFASTLALE